MFFSFSFLTSHDLRVPLEVAPEYALYGAGRTRDQQPVSGKPAAYGSVASPSPVTGPNPSTGPPPCPRSVPSGAPCS
eukprot:13038543-Heterocapsa_arctica.AAC.1